ncbi:hypothetical protein GCM10009775_30070 [Microbacterium aoyamense]|uniref:EAL domain-containing protein n=1 Tax=Microbacterium aoyamense TaxID=344166 RepID=A0ABN2PWZ5_9MICO|nr:EAL domain-containing protein [Microbacterium aoyamense]
MHDTASLTRDLRSALATSQLTIAYQVQWQLDARTAELSTMRPVSVEALSRWNHPELGVVAPDMFIPLAEEGGFLDELDLQVLYLAAVQVRRWRQHGADIGLAANASPARFTASYGRRIIKTVERAGLEPDAVTIEVTETPAPQLRPDMRAAVDLLHQAGMSISVDDFDGEMTTMAMLESLPIDEVKIDRSLTRRSDTAADEVVAGVIRAAESHGWRTVAEGIETLEDLDRSRGRSCQRGQGYLWGRPATAQELEPVLLGA